jgi:Family of unknown function (DUF6318)
MRSQTGRWVACSLVILAVISGCSANASPPSGTESPSAGQSTSAGGSPPTVSPTPPVSPTIAVYKPADASGPAQNVPLPVKPPLADEFSKEGLEAFAKYWYSTLSYAYETGDMAPLEAITDPGCQTCAKVKASVVPWHSEGRWTVGGGLVVEAAQSTFTETPEGEYQAIVIVHQEQITYYKADGTVVETRPATSPITDILVGRYMNGHWTTTTAEHVSGKAS